LKGKWTGGSVRLLAVGLPVLGLAVVAAVFGVRSGSQGSGSGDEEAAWLSPGPVRFLEARLSHPAAKDVEAPADLGLPSLGAWEPVGQGITVKARTGSGLTPPGPEEKSGWLARRAAGAGP
jgi:hypothetical protein